MLPNIGAGAGAASGNKETAVGARVLALDAPNRGGGVCTSPNTKPACEVLGIVTGVEFSANQGASGGAGVEQGGAVFAEVDDDDEDAAIPKKEGSALYFRASFP